MRLIPLLAAALVLAGGAHAQNEMRPAPSPQNAVPPVPPSMPATPPDGMAPSSPGTGAGMVPARPNGWRGSDSEWRAHVRTCQQAHAGYDPGTDQYRDETGAARTCPR